MDKKTRDSQTKYRKSNPWIYTLSAIRTRCTNPKKYGYEYYGGKGIQCKISSKQIKELWFRDKAYLMKKPSIDRIDSNKNYQFSNCRFIELSENIGRIYRTSVFTILACVLLHDNELYQSAIEYVCKKIKSKRIYIGLEKKYLNNS